METELSECRICKCTNLVEVINLGNQIITSRFPMKGDTSTPSAKIRIVQCASCSLVQLKDTTDSSELYEHFYGYRSGLNATMRNHLTSYNEQLQGYANLVPGDTVLDIGSNDCTFIGHYPSTVRRIGCDPTGTQFTEFYKTTGTELLPTYFTKAAITSALGPDIRFKSVSSISMFYDLPDPVQFAQDIYDLLDDDGVWTLEQSYVATMLERNSIDTVCHEHLEYYGVKQIKNIMDRVGFKIINLSLNDCNGGSFRTFVAKRSSDKFQEATETVNRFLEKEEADRIHTPERYAEFMKTCSKEVESLNKFIDLVNQDGKVVYIYGASTKGNCLLQFADIGSSKVPFAVERNPLKVGRITSTGIEIISEETMRSNPPDYMLVLPWHFRKEMIAREQAYLDGGGQLLFPFPAFEVYSSKPKTLVTGIDGQVGQYLTKVLNSNANLYGITKSSIRAKGITRFRTDLTDRESLNTMLRLVRPNQVVHLAALSNTEECEADPVLTVSINCEVAANLCDSLYRNKIDATLFHASSSELYRGHGTYEIQENDPNMRPSTMYGICKAAAHSIVDSYRTRYGLPFSNGVLFTTESKLRKPTFLLKKVALHATQVQTGLYEPLVLGRLDSFRTITHAEDVANAIRIILDQPQGDTYLICASNHQTVEDLVLATYSRHGIILEKRDAGFYNTKDSRLIVKTNSDQHGRDEQCIDITGQPTKLRNIGWNPAYKVADILADMS